MLSKRVVKPPKRLIADFETDLENETESKPKKNKKRKLSKNLTSSSDPIVPNLEKIKTEIKEEPIEINETIPNFPEEEKNISKKKFNPFKCDLCPEHFDDRNKLKRHNASVHEKKKFYKCEFEGCTTTFSQKVSIKAHITAVHERKRLKCIECAKDFSNKANLKAHMESVHEEKSFECKICNNKFGWKQGLSKHIELVHEGVNTKPFECPICNHRCVKKSELQAHMNSGEACMKFLMNYENLISDVNKLHECSKCHKRFSSSKNLDFHVLFKHDYKVPNSCSICDLMFWTNKDLTSRIKAMTKHINEVHKNSPIKNVANKVVDHEIVIQHKEEIGNSETLEIIKKEVDLDLQNIISKKNPEGKCENCQEMILPIDLDLHMKNCKTYSKFMKKSDCFSGYKCQLCFFTTSLLKIGNNTWNDLRNSMYNHIRQNHRFNVQFLSKKFDTFENKNNSKNLFSKSQEQQENPTTSTTKKIFDFIEADANYIKVEPNQFEDFLTEENSFSNSIKQEPLELDFDDTMVENKNSETAHNIAEPEIEIKVGSSESENLIFGKIKNEPIDDDVSSVSSNTSETETSESETSTDDEISDSGEMGERRYIIGEKSETKCENCQEIIHNSGLAMHTRNCQVYSGVYSKFMKRCTNSNHYECQICYAKIGLRKKMYTHLKNFHDISSTPVNSKKKTKRILTPIPEESIGETDRSALSYSIIINTRNTKTGQMQAQSAKKADTTIKNKNLVKKPNIIRMEDIENEDFSDSNMSTDSEMDIKQELENELEDIEISDFLSCDIGTKQSEQSLLLSKSKQKSMKKTKMKESKAVKSLKSKGTSAINSSRTKNVAKEIWVTENDMDEGIENLDAVIEKESLEKFDDKHPVETYDFVQN